VIVLDTNVLSELMKPTPAESVVRWMAAQPTTSLYTTSITRAEILHGIMLLPSGKRRSAFEAAAEAMFKEDFGGRVLPFGSDAAHPYARSAAAPAAPSLTSTHRSPRSHTPRVHRSQRATPPTSTVAASK